MSSMLRKTCLHIVSHTHTIENRRDSLTRNPSVDHAACFLVLIVPPPPIPF
ncbi:MAG: hypothetical protein LBK25_05955 [Treponema sp.]|nr:hypothetical protein [Treponema sp.]